MLYHVPDLAKAIAEIRRVLKPDGVLFAMTNGDQHLRELEAIIETLQQGDAESEIGLMGDVRKAFRLQTGADALRQQFSQVTREDFDSHLHVTELPPLMDYIASVMDDPAARMDTPQAQALWQTLEQQIAQDGAIHITKETGLFTARPVRQSDEVS
jgi:SAM-dependent methyltransferase